MTSACIQQIFSRPLAFGDIHKGNYGALNYIFQGAIGTDAHQVLRARYGLCLGVMRSQAIQHGLHVVNQTVVADQVGNDVSHRASDVGLDLVDQLGGGRCEAGDAQLPVYKDGPHPGAGQQIVRVLKKYGWCFGWRG